MQYDLVVVGAGPAGCRTAQIVAKAGYKVLVVEEHGEVGVPTQCTALVSEKIGEIPKEIIVNEINTAKFCSDGNSFEIKSKDPMYLLDRCGFDKFIYRQAVDSGAEFKLNTHFLSYEKIGDTADALRVKTSNGNFETKILVGADGPNSNVARVADLRLPKKLLYLMQVRAKVKCDPETVEMWFGSDIAPGNFAWVVPENESYVRIGMMSNASPKELFEKFFDKRTGYSLRDVVKISNRIGDVIRYGLIEKSATSRILLVGDAAAQIKPFSAGGLVYGQICAKFAGKACIKALQKNNFSEKFLTEEYDKKWKNELSGGIKKGLFFKKVFKSIQDRPFAFSLIKKTRLAVLASFFDIDFIGK